mgnify:CR=1 FL=1
MPKIIDAEPVVKKLKDWLEQIEAEYPFSEKGDSEGIECCIAELQEAPTIDPKTLRPVAHWVEIPGSYVSNAGSKGSWCVPATRCSNPDCREVNPCGLKTPFCPMCGFRMEDKKNEV